MTNNQLIIKIPPQVTYLHGLIATIIVLPSMAMIYAFLNFHVFSGFLFALAFLGYIFIHLSLGLLIIKLYSFRLRKIFRLFKYRACHQLSQTTEAAR